MKTYNRTKSGAHRSAFTLIELLVVITIIAILASIAAPVFNSVQKKAQQTKALSYGKQIGLACKLWALDDDGNFPRLKADQSGDATTSSELFGTLISTNLIPNEQVFYVVGDYSAANVKLVAPNNDGTLDATENGWSYCLGLSETDDPNSGLVFTQTDGAGAWATVATNPGGVWDGRAIVVNIDYSGTVVRPNNAGKIFRTISGSSGVDITTLGTVIDPS